MRDLRTGRLLQLAQSPDGLLHDAQPPAAIGVKAAQLGADGQPLVEPGAFFCDGNYSLAINSWNALAGVAITVRVRWLTADGRLTDSDFQHTPNTNRTKATTVVPLGVGFALNVMVFASTGAPLRGQTFIQIQLVRGLTGVLLPVATLLQDYVTAVQAVAWPGSPIRSSIEGGGFPRTIVGAAPAAGANINEAVPTGARWLLRSFFSNLVTSAVVANRVIQLAAFNGANVKAFSPSTVNQVASKNWAYSWSQGLVLATRADNNAYAIPWIMNLPLLAGETLQTQTSGIDAGDQWSAPNYAVEELLEAAS